MTCYEAPSCRQALNEATKLWPNRRKTSDGICASSRHSKQNPNSDHEPNVYLGGRYYATAFDLSDDPENGCDADQFAEDLRLRRDPRVKYVICNKRIFSSYATSRYPAWTWRPYTGSNPHITHTHVSTLPTREAIFDTSPWFLGDDMTESERKMLEEVHQWLGRVHHELVFGDTQNATLIQMVERMDKRIATIEKKLR